MSLKEGLVLSPDQFINIHKLISRSVPAKHHQRHVIRPKDIIYPRQSRTEFVCGQISLKFMRNMSKAM